MMKRLTPTTFLFAAILCILVACVPIPNPAAAPALPVANDNPLIAEPAQAPEQSTDVLFKTPEEAIIYYMDGVVQNDINKILQACAITEMGEKFNFDLYTERLGYAISPNYSLAPSEYPLYAEMNKVQVAARILAKLKFFAYGLLSGEGIDGSVLVLDEERIDRFVQNVDPGRLSTLEVEKITLPNEAIMSEARYQETAEKNANAFGADALTERVLLFSFEGEYFYIGLTLLRYGESWKISDLGSVLANTSPLGVPTHTTIEEFESMFGSN